MGAEIFNKGWALKGRPSKTIPVMIELKWSQKSQLLQQKVKQNLK